jgi:hypothetical protein
MDIIYYVCYDKIIVQSIEYIHWLDVIEEDDNINLRSSLNLSSVRGRSGPVTTT